ncbi:hypothetical protein LCGC14_0438910 [marine sediment metagenome]|uniref:Uncharacterized protein n=1 Tax=marine sediment metagenome TaxID=412755 RepID=A0A0F9VV03_9ZZZZ
MATKEEILERLEGEDIENQEDLAQDNQDDIEMNRKEFEEAYGSPEPEPIFNKHAFIDKSLETLNPEKVTFLTTSELGRPLFNVRFLLDIEDICGYYLDDLFKKYDVVNKISAYFREKINNISDSGLSNEGFIQTLNVTNKMDMTRKRVKNNISNLKGGQQKQIG